MTLNDLAAGESCTVTEIMLKNPLKKRLLDMGMTRGAYLTVLRRAPFGGPCEFMITGFRLSLRRRDAEKIIVKRSISADE